MIYIASIAFRRFMRARLASKPNPPVSHFTPFCAARAVASDDPAPLPEGSSSRPGGSAVEAGRSAKQSDPGDECDCAVCSSDLAGIVPCALSEDEEVPPA